MNGLIEQRGITSASTWHNFSIIYKNIPTGWSSYKSTGVYADTCCSFTADINKFYLAFARNIQNSMNWKAVGY